MSSYIVQDRFRLHKLFHRFLLLEIFQSVTKEHALFKLFYTNNVSRQFAINNYDFVNRAVKGQDKREITLQQLISQRMIDDEKEAFYVYGLQLLTAEDIVEFHKIKKEYHQSGFLLDRIILVDTIHQQKEKFRKYFKLIEEITPKKLTILENYQSKQTFTIPFKLDYLKIQARDTQFLDQIENLKNLIVTHIELKLSNNKKLSQYLPILLINSTIKEIIIHKASAQNLITLFTSLDRVAGRELFNRLRIQKVEIRHPNNIKKILTLHQQYRFSITKLHIHEMILDIEEQYLLFQLVNTVKVLYLDQITIRNFDSGLLQKVLDMPNPQIEEVHINAFYLYDFEPFSTVLTIKYAQLMKKTSLSFQNFSVGQFQHVIPDLAPYFSMINYSRLQEIEFFNCNQTVIDWFAVGLEPFKVRKLTVSESLTSENLSKLFSVKHLKHLVLMSSILNKDRLKTYHQMLSFAKFFVNIERMEFSQYEIWYQAWPQLDPIFNDLKEIKYTGNFVNPDHDSFVEGMKWIFKTFPRAYLMEMEITDRNQYDILNSLQFKENFDDKYMIQCNLLGQSLVQVTKRKIRQITNS